MSWWTNLRYSIFDYILYGRVVYEVVGKEGWGVGTPIKAMWGSRMEK